VTLLGQQIGQGVALFVQLFELILQNETVLPAWLGGLP
jgi:hypothetical protein